MRRGLRLGTFMTNRQRRRLVSILSTLTALLVVVLALHVSLVLPVQVISGLVSFYPSSRKDCCSTGHLAHHNADNLVDWDSYKFGCVYSLGLKHDSQHRTILA